MTHKEFFEAIARDYEGNEEMTNIAKGYLASLAKKNEKAKEKRLAKNEADEPLVAAFLSALTSDQPLLASEAAKVVGISTPKLVSIAVKLEKSGKIVSHDVKVPKVGTRKGYTLA